MPSKRQQSSSKLSIAIGGLDEDATGWLLGVGMLCNLPFARAGVRRPATGRWSVVQRGKVCYTE